MSVSNSAFGTSSSGAVSSVSNSDGSLTISPTTGSVVASLDTANANTWTANQFIGNTGIFTTTPAGTQYGLGVSSNGNFNLNGSSSGNDSTISVGGTPKMVFTTGNVNMNNGGFSFVNQLSGGNQANQLWQLAGLSATSGNTLENSGYMQFVGQYWNGSVSVPQGMQINWIQDTTNPVGHLSFNYNNDGSVSEVFKITQAGYIVFGGSLSLLNGYNISISNNGTFNTYGSFFQVSNSGIRYNNMTPTILNGTTAGSISYNMLEQGSAYKKVMLIFNGYENTTATAQTITFPTAFSQNNVIVANSTSTSPTLSLTTLTLPINMSSTASGVIIIEGV